MVVQATGSSSTHTLPEEDSVESSTQDDQSGSSEIQEEHLTVTADGFYSQADLETMGLDPKVASYLIQDFAHNSDGENPEITGETLLRFERGGWLNINQGGTDNSDSIEVPIIARDGYNVLELIA